MKTYRRLIWFFLIAAALSGCSMNQNTEKKTERKAVEYTVVDERKLPAELLKLIRENEKKEMKWTFSDGEVLYLIRGYGEQKSGGYSISVLSCTEDEESVYLETRLLGPKETDAVREEPSWPSIVVKVENRDKLVRYE